VNEKRTGRVLPSASIEIFTSPQRRDATDGQGQGGYLISALPPHFYAESIRLYQEQEVTETNNFTADRPAFAQVSL
jgi:hypothetical protein